MPTKANKQATASPTSPMSSGKTGAILIVDDEESLRSFMEIMLSKEGHSVMTSASGPEALDIMREHSFDLVVTDMMMPTMSGLELLGKSKEIDGDQEFIVMTAFGSMDSAIEAMKLGAADYITKPFNIDQIKLAVDRALDKRRLVKENTILRKELGRDVTFENIVGKSDALKEVISLARQVSATDSTVLIRGESGVGKDLLARAIHNSSPRVDGPFVTLNCAALPENLLESELFGHKKGSFTGAIRDKQGLFQSASGGTLFLDEIGNVSHAMQVRLLRVLEDQMITPVGETKPVKVDVRLLAATNANLEKDVEAGTFRADLYYRLNVIQLELPSLRDRREDIVPLAEMFVENFGKRLRKPNRKLSAEACQALTAYDWPGNVRELENSIERAVLLANGETIVPDDFPARLTSSQSGANDGLVSSEVSESAEPVTPTLQSIEKAYIHYIMAENNGNKSRAAKALGIDSSTLYRKLERYGWSKKKSHTDEEDKSMQ